MSSSFTVEPQIKDTLLHHTTLINGYLVKLRRTSIGADDNIFRIKREINTILTFLSKLNGNYDEEIQENIKAIIDTGKRISRHRERDSILKSQQTFEDWIAEISSLKLTLTQSNGSKIIYSAERAIRVFLSYSHMDSILVAEIKKTLEDNGIEAFLAHEDIGPSKEWEKEIIRSLNECDVFIPFINDNFMKSKWTDQESGIAFARGKFILPINIGLVSYGFIGRYQALKYKDGPLTSKEIIEAIMNKNSLMKKRIKDDLIKKFKESQTFLEAGRAVDKLKDVEPFTEIQVNELLRAYMDNNQLFLARIPDSFIQRIVESHANIIHPALITEYELFVTTPRDKRDHSYRIEDVLS